MTGKKDSGEMNMKNIAIVLAAGRGKRMGTAIPKQFLEIEGKPVIYYTLQSFEMSELVDEVILVTGEETKEYCQKEIVEKFGFHKVRKVISGGKERYDSVYEGLKACEDCSYVYIHDGARPFVTEDVIRRTLEGAKEYGASIAAVPSKDTVKVGNPQGLVVETLDRSVLWNVQTPQTFSYSLIRKAHEEMRKRKMTGITDDSMLVEELGLCPVKLVEGSYDNIKITTPEDIILAEKIIQNKRALA
ncbi:MAG: 2-C-methyl-D-erythritol 4-phosphate cytidylyltransferase [Muricoprocola sp.]